MSYKLLGGIKMENAIQIFKESLIELENLMSEYNSQLIKLELKYGKNSIQVENKKSVIHGFEMRIRQTKYLAEKFGIEIN
jgi:ppGpp synthetase/RelA/SpoT-type nucleotidyltranferase